MARAIQGNRGSQELIHSIHARVTFAYPDRAVPAGELAADPCSSAEYWRDANAVRVREVYPRTVNEYLLTKGRGRLISKETVKDGSVRVGANLRSRTDSAMVADVWEIGLLSFEFVPLFAHLSNVSERATATSADLGGRLCVRIDVVDRGRRCEFWLDPEVNYLARKTAVRTDSGVVIEREALRFREHQPGVYFPEKVVQRYRPAPGTPARPWTQEIVFDPVHINRPISEQVFRLVYPRGTILVDELQGLTYPVDESGNRIGPANRLVSAVPNAREQADRTQTPLDSAEERNGWVWVGFITAVVAAGLLVATRYRKRSS